MVGFMICMILLSLGTEAVPSQVTNQTVALNATACATISIWNGNNTQTASITSYGFPHNPYLPETDKCWVLTASTSHVTLVIKRFSLENSTGCVKDYVEIRDGIDNNSTLLARICGSVIGQWKFRSSRHSLFFRFRTDKRIQDKGFQLNYFLEKPQAVAPHQNKNQSVHLNTTTCTPTSIKVNSTEYVHLRSDGFPQTPYLPDTDKCWILTGSTGNVTLVTKSFSLENSTNCSKDFVEIRDGADLNSVLLAKICGSIGYREITSSRSSLLVRFKTNSQNQDKGFEFECRAKKYQIEISDQNLNKTVPTNTTLCTHTTILIRHESSTRVSYLRSGGFPQAPYPPNTEKCWVLMALSSHVTLVIKNFSLENSTDCSKDFVEIRNGVNRNSTLLARLCGSVGRRKFTSSGRSLFVRFKTDDTIQDQGFELSYYKEQAKIVVPDDSRNQSALPNITKCIPTSINIPHGNSTEHAYLRSDGFPQTFYLPNTDKCWVLMALSSNVTMVTKNFSLENSTDCSKDYFEIRDGINLNSTLLARLCGAVGYRKFTSSGRSLFVRFKTDDAIQDMGFELRYYEEQTKIVVPEHSINRSVHLNTTCTPTSINVSNSNSTEYAHLRSDGFPRTPYLPDTDKCWVLTASTGNVTLETKSFNLENSSNCSKDFVEIRDGADPNSLLLARMCGSIGYRKFTSSERSLFVRFQTNSNNQDKGFELKYREKKYQTVPGQDSNKTISTNTTVCTLTTVGVWHASNVGISYLRSDGFPQRRYPPNTDKCWALIAVTSRVTLVIRHFSLENSTDCSKDFIEIRDGVNLHSTLLDRLCGSVGYRKFISSGRSLFVRFKTDNTIQDKGFELGYYREQTNIAITIKLNLRLIGSAAGVFIICVVVLSTIVYREYIRGPRPLPGYQSREMLG